MTEQVDLGIDELSDFQVIGTGGFSTVYSAWDEGFRRRVAVKLLHSLDEAGRRRFDRERGIMGQLSSHPNVITPFRAGYTTTGAPFLVMEYVSGGSLHDQVSERGPLPWVESVEYVVPLAAALSHAHDHGVLHKDVKPANVLLAGQVPKLTDFGIAAIRESTASQIAFTLAHCPPETFATGRDARDERSDLYSLASTLFTLVVGQPPFAVDGEDSQQAYMFRIIDHRVPDPAPDQVPEPLRAFFLSSLAKDPGERPQTAQDFQDGLQRLRAAHSAPDATGRLHPPSPFHPGTTTSNRSGQPDLDVTTRETVTIGAPVQESPTTGPSSQGAYGGDADGRPLVGTPTHRRRPRLLMALAVLLLAGAAGAAGWWLLDRGEDPPPVAWTFETNSSLASKPAVAGNTLVIGAHITNTIHAIDTGSGLERWSFETRDGVDAGPTIVGDTVYIGSLDGSMYALALADGALVWEQELGTPVKAAALLDMDLVVVGTELGDIWGLDRLTGTPRWSTAIGGMITSKPAQATVGGRAVIVIGGTDGGLYLLDPDSGDQIERIALNGGVWFSNPLVVDRPDGGGQEVWVGTSEADRGFLNRIALETAEVVTFETRAGVGTDPVITDDGLVIAGNDAGDLFAVSRITLGEVWREGYADRNQIKGSPVVVGDQIIFGTHDKELISVDHRGAERWRFGGEQIFGLSAPVVVDDRLYVGNDAGTVYRFDL